MDVEILYIEDCPNWAEAGERVRFALDEVGLNDVEIRYRLLRSPEEAVQVPFAGSPTILINGVDAFPTDGTITDLACRVYFTGSRFAGLPAQDQLRELFARRSFKGSDALR